MESFSKLGHTFFSSGQYQRSLDQFQEYQATNPTVENTIWIGRCYFHLKTEERHLFEVRDTLPTTARGRHIPYQALREGWRTVNHFDTALAWFDRASRMDSGSALAHFWMGRALKAQGNLKLAYDSFHVAAQLNPTYQNWCRQIFDQKASITGRQLLSLTDEVLDLLNSASPFDRMQGCLKVINTDGALKNEAVAQRINQMQGRIYCGLRICYTGDSDQRIRNLACEILR